MLEKSLALGYTRSDSLDFFQSNIVEVQYTWSLLSEYLIVQTRMAN